MSTSSRTQADGTDESVVIYIHGVGQQAPRDALKQQWDLALFGRDLGTRSRMAYWADLLHPPSAASVRPGAARAATTARALKSAAADASKSVDRHKPMTAGQRAELASFKMPRRWVRVEALPRTALGKVQKHLLPPAP
jgi:acyl-CoA synthetase (AMP-forming)/AMP-acid ligase II